MPLWGFPDGSTNKEAAYRDVGSVPGSGRFLAKEMVTCSSALAWSILWTEELCRLQSMGSQRVRHDWACAQTLYDLNLLNLSQLGFWSIVCTVFVNVYSTVVLFMVKYSISLLIFHLLSLSIIERKVLKSACNCGFMYFLFCFRFSFVYFKALLFFQKQLG